MDSRTASLPPPPLRLPGLTYAQQLSARSPLLRYSLATALFLLALFARFELSGVLPATGFPFLTFFPAVILAAFFVGFGPGLFTATLSMLAAWFFFIRPAHPVALPASDVVALVFFAGILLIDCIVIHLMKDALSRVSRTEQQLRDASQRVYRVLDKLHVYVAILNLDGTVQEINDEPLRVARLSRNDVLERYFWQLPWWYGDIDAERQVRSAVEQAAGGETVRFDIQVQAHALSFAIDLQVVPLREGNGAITALIASGVDISARVHAMTALGDADRQKDEFLATLAHELRNPLAPIRTAAELIRLREPADETVQRARLVIERQAIHLSRLVDDLLDVSRITRGTIELKLQTLDAVTVAAHAIESVRPILESAGLTLAWNPRSLPLAVQADSTRLGQCILNLLTNAIKFTQPGGAIEVRVHRDGARALIDVSDSGSGIAAENLEKIFGLFVQENPSGLHGNTGLGIGLALTRKLVSLHGGSVVATSRGAGLGSRFRIDLPALASADGMNAGQPDAGYLNVSVNVSDKGTSILLVEDHHDAAALLAEYLQMSDFRVTLASSGKEALRAVQLSTPDAVLLDIGLPDMDGYRVCRSIRQLDNIKQPVIIALTGWGTENDRTRATEAGFNAHLTKPAEPEQIVALLHALIADARVGAAGVAA